MCARSSSSIRAPSSLILSPLLNARNQHQRQGAELTARQPTHVASNHRHPHPHGGTSLSSMLLKVTMHYLRGSESLNGSTSSSWAKYVWQALSLCCYKFRQSSDG